MRSLGDLRGVRRTQEDLFGYNTAPKDTGATQTASHANENILSTALLCSTPDMLAELDYLKINQSKLCNPLPVAISAGTEHGMIFAKYESIQLIHFTHVLSNVSFLHFGL